MKANILTCLGRDLLIGKHPWADPTTNNTPSMPAPTGILYVVATPIGNLQDISARAIETLQAVDLIACEDTRRTGRLLQRLNIRQKLLSYHDHNEQLRAPSLCQQLAEGHSIALISDAGTPCVNDPGFRLIARCHQQQIPVCPIPGPSAMTTLLSASGLPTHAFLFLGFPPIKPLKRIAFLKQYAGIPHTLVLFESTHRIEKLLQDISDILGGDRLISLGRELTKQHEFLRTATCQTIIECLESTSKKGEFTVAIAPQDFQLPAVSSDSLSF